MFHFSVFALKKNFLYFTKNSLFNNVCIYIVKRNFGGVKVKKCHKHSCNEKCGICWFLKKANNDKRNIIFLILLSLLFVTKTLIHGKDKLREEL